MDAKIKAKWVAALRSGEFKQGHETLRKDDRYCCLGVLCALDPNVAWETRSRQTDSQVFIALGMGDAELEPDYREEIGLSVDDHFALMSMNDGNISESEALRWGVQRRDHTFAEIADWIEANL